MSKIDLGKQPFLYPMPMSVVSVKGEGRVNHIAVGWLTPVNYQPPMIAIALGKHHFTNGLIKEAKAFSVNIPGVRDMKKTDYVGLVSGAKTDKSQVFGVEWHEERIPFIPEFPINLLCDFHSVIALPSNEVFIGTVVKTLASAECVVEGKPDIAKIDPLVLTMPDNRYWRIGESVGKAWNAGREENHNP